MSTRAVHAAYYVAHTAKSLLWTAGDLATIYALVSLYGVDPEQAGWLFLIGLAANALADWAVGIWLDRHPERAAGLAAAGLIVASLAFPFTMLAAPLGWRALLAATLVFRLSYAAYDVPHNALLSRLAEATGAATRLSRGRTLGTGAAAALVGLGLHNANSASQLPWFTVALAGAAMLGGMALMPLLARLSVSPPAEARTAEPALPWRFLGGSLIGIVALGVLAKAILHLPAGIARADAGTIVILLIGGRTVAALLPMAFADARRGLRLLSGIYVGGAIAVVPLLWAGGWVLPIILGLLLGATNLVGWALLPLLARGARSYGLYTMASKLALGVAGIGMAAALGGGATFAPERLNALAAITIAACILTALLLFRRGLTGPASQGASVA